jgi:hypothetical protein
MAGSIVKTAVGEEDVEKGIEEIPVCRKQYIICSRQNGGKYTCAAFLWRISRQYLS